MKNTKEDIMFKAKEDGFLLELVRNELSAVPKGKIKSYLEHGLIYVDGKSTSKFNFPVKAGAAIRIKTTGKGTIKCPFEIIYEDNELLAVNKPAGLLSVASDKEKENTAIRLLRESGFSPLYVVHRLDRDTSGVLLFAKSTEMRDKLQEDWENIKTREYLAVCEGIFEKKSGRCDTILRETSTHMVYSVKSGDGKRAITNYEVLRENNNYSLLRILIETGRKNQIRVHMKELEHPVAGDKKYGAKGSPMGRLGLHASMLEFKHPRTGEIVTIKAAADKKFKLPKESGLK